MSILANHGLLGLELSILEAKFMGFPTPVTNHTFTFNDPPDNGNVMYVFSVWHGAVGASGNITLPSGWSQLSSIGHGAGQPTCQLYYKVAGVGESNSYNFVSDTTSITELIGIKIVNYNPLSLPYEGLATSTTGASNATNITSGNISAQPGSNVLIGYGIGGSGTSNPTLTNGYIVMINDVSSGSGVLFKRYTSTITEGTNISGHDGNTRQRTISWEIK